MGGNSVKDDTDKKYGESLQYDPDFNGPIKNRSCTDILCLLLFIVFLITWIVVAVLAFRFGNPEKLIYPTDSFGHVCGEGEFSDRPVLFFFDLTECARAGSLVHGCQTHQVCVKTCPDGNYFPAIEFITDNRPANQIPDYEKKFFCKYDTDLSQPARELLQKGFCAKYLLQSDAVGTDFHREVFSELDYPVKNPFVGRCVPTIKSVSNAIHNFSAKMEEMNVTEDSVQKGADFISKFGELRNVGEKFLEDLQNSWKIILLALGVATLLSFIWIVLMRWLAWVMLWLSIFLVLGVLGVGCWYCFHRYTALVDSGEDHTFRITSFKSYAEQKKTWLGLGIFLAIVLVILVLMIIFLRSRIRLAIALVEESSNSNLESMKQIQKLRRRANGIDVAVLAVGKKETTTDDTSTKDPFSLKLGGMVDMKVVTVGKDVADELSIGTTFSAETNRRDEDADMMKYIDEQLARRKDVAGDSLSKRNLLLRGKSVANSIPPEPEVKLPEDALYEVPEHLRISSSKKSEEMLSNQMLSGIPEVDLGIEAKIRNIEATEDAKQKLVRERMNKKDGPSQFVPTNMAVNFVQHNRFNIEDGTDLPKPKKSKEVKCTPVVVGDGEAPNLVLLEETKRQPHAREEIEKATDDFHFEKFKKQFRRY